jgi:hypothetical protein
VKKVAIVGAQEMTRDKAPFDDPSYEIWGFADWLCAPWMKRCGALIEIHLANVYTNHPRTPQYWDALQKTEIPVFMYPVADPRVPNSILYPLDSVLGLVAKGKNQGKSFKPFNSTVAYALGLAILYEYDVIDIYGVELANPSERFLKQSEMFAFWNGVALGRGIELNINCSDGLFVQPLYGSEDTIPSAKLYQYLSALNSDIQIYQQNANMAIGAKNMIQQLLGEGS